MPIKPWGKLVGVRPTKIVHYMWDEDYSDDDILHCLVDHYELIDEKAELLLSVARHERPLLDKIKCHPSWVCLYVGIPFCPSRCSYCSFVSYSLKDSQGLRDAYVQALIKELASTAELVDRAGQKVYSIYIGGGTPTCLSDESFRELLMVITDRFKSSTTVEFTVEAGRPKTITQEKLRIMKEMGVTRVSVNPQSMHERTLRSIGRFHSPEDVERAVRDVREFGFALNMDAILGLQGETTREVEYTIDRILALQPENITLHALAIKRASTINLENKLDGLPSDKEAVRMARCSYRMLNNSGYLPYYMYRQRNIIGQLENIGYTLPGFDCIYNIMMIEERMTVYACGAGSVSKILGSGNGEEQFTRLANAKDPRMYIDGLSCIVAKKKKVVCKNG